MDFTETYAILENVPKDGGSLSEPILFYISAGVHNDSLNFYLQYGKKSRQFLMHVRECSSKAITLHCTHARSKSAKCKATAKIIILDPKVIKSEKKLQAKRDRTIFKLDYEFPDIKDLSKYGTVTTIKPHTCQSTPSLFGVSREFRHTNGKLSVNLNKDQTQSQFDNSNLTDIMSVDKLSRKAGFSLRKEKFSAQKKIQNSKSYIMKGLIFFDPEFVKTALSQFRSVKIPTFPKKLQPLVRAFLTTYFEKQYLSKSDYSGWNLFGPLSRYETSTTNNCIESYHNRLKMYSGSGKNTLDKTCSVIKKAKTISRLAYNNGEFNLRDKAVIEKHASLQNFHFQLSLQTPEFVRANSLEICLKIGDILLVPNKKEDPVYFSTFKFPEQC
uniref:Uncharacterized protein n=1 Tax=Oikopleura dioica TaxID=34765 RepID=Q675T6_OIKDI|nr:hypothetical protein 005-07 [Oikopleura dioica]